MKHFIYTIILITLSSCSGLFTSTPSLQSGDYTLLLKLDGVESPVRLIISASDTSMNISVKNDTEIITAERIDITGDSLFFSLPIFNSIFKGRITSSTSFEGNWYNYHKGEDYFIPFTASLNSEGHSTESVEPIGNWEVTFSKGTEDESKAIGVFRKGKNKITGTFLTETGDYRYLEGKITGTDFYLSCFDGSHAFQFTGTFVNDSTITNGMFYSGKHWKEQWIASRNDTFKLRDAYSLTHLNPGYDRISFTFPNLENKKVSLDDPQFKDKVVIIQLMGTWCPNCLDESIYFTDLYKRKQKDGLEIIALAYESRPDFEYAKTRVEQLKTRLGSAYTFLIAGTSDKKEAQKTLPMLNQVMSFPTTIVLDKKHNISSIYTGFSGPGTGKAYEDYKVKTEAQLDSLLRN